MAETVFLRYPCPASIKTAPSNNFAQKKRPGGGTYSRPEGHGGSDIKPAVRGVVGDPVFPVRDGKIVWVGTESESSKWGDDYGNRVLVKHVFTFRGKPFTRYSFYAHLDSVSVERGQKVSVRDQLGTMGDTGHSTGAHVHFEWHSSPEWRRGLRDPFPPLDEIRRKQLSE
jgi:murein DD-endopeptidase MepM/ murein hydrolase activator NlpD